MGTGIQSDPKILDGPSPEAVRAQLGRMLQSRTFSRSARLSRFLKFGVEVALGGRAAVNEYAIGVDVFERGADFNPRIDPIVRVHARRLRSRLAEYYASEGVDDALEIYVPLRAYTPSFRMRQPDVRKAPASLPEGPRAAVSLALLPFTRLSSREEDQFFTDGLTREIADQLSRSPDWNVLSWPVPRGEGVPDLSDLVGRGDVQAGLTGAVRRADGVFRVSAELISIPGRAILWSGMYEADAGQPVVEQQRIAREIFRHVRAAHPRPAEQGLARAALREAGELYIKGLFSYSQCSRSNLEKCVQRLVQSLNADPGYGAAHSALAEAFVCLTLYGDYPPNEIMPEVAREAEQALHCGDLAGGRLAKALVSALHEWDWRTAESGFQRLVEMGTRVSSAREWLAAACLTPAGHFDEAIAQLNLAKESDPLSLTIPNHLGYALTAAGRPELALHHLGECLELESNFALTHWTLGLAFLAAGQSDQAIRAFQRAVELSSGASYVRASLGHAYAMVRQSGEAGGILRILSEKSKTSYVPASDMALVHLGLGDHDSALKCLEAAHGQHCGWLARMNIDPRMAPLRAAPRFRALLGELRLAPLSG